MTKLSSKQLYELRVFDLAMVKHYSYTPNSYKYLQFGFYHGDRVMFVGQNPGLSQSGVPREASQALYTDYFLSKQDYHRYLKEYERVLHLPTCPMGNFIDDVYGSDWKDISFTNVYKNPFKNHKVDVKDNKFFDMYLQTQIETIHPYLLCTIGKTASDAIKRINEQYGKKFTTRIVNFAHYSYLKRQNTYDETITHYKNEMKWMLEHKK